jgi:cytoskeletal protein CcmA (bactofilin family)
MTEEKRTRMSSVLGETAVVIGNVKGAGDLEIRGRVQGSVEVTGRILVANSAVVLGGIDAVHISVAGQVRGDLSASDGVHIHASGHVEGNIFAPRVGIDTGARVRGVLRTGDASEKLETEASEDEQEAKTPIQDQSSERENRTPISLKTRTKEGSQAKGRGRRRPRPRRSDRDLPDDRLKNSSAAQNAADQSGAEGKNSGVGPAGERHTRKGQSTSMQPASGPPASSPPAESAKSSDPPGKNKGKQKRPKLPTFVKGAKGHQRA